MSLQIDIMVTLSALSANDTLAILGKGAETYQEIKGKKFPYSDVEVVKGLLQKNT